MRGHLQTLNLLFNNSQCFCLNWKSTARNNTAARLPIDHFYNHYNLTLQYLRGDFDSASIPQTLICH